jgi:hypothetical protein
MYNYSEDLFCQATQKVLGNYGKKHEIFCPFAKRRVNKSFKSFTVNYPKTHYLAALFSQPSGKFLDAQEETSHHVPRRRRALIWQRKKNVR